MKSEKEKLAAKTIDQLKAAAKRLGGKLVTPDGKAKTKVQLINTIVMKNRLAGKSMGAKQTGTSNKAADLKRKAKAPGKRTSAKGKVYTETRKNRTDKPGTMLGEKPYNELPDVRTFEVNVLSPTNTMGTRIKIVDTGTLASKTIPKNYSQGAMSQAKDYLNSLGIKIFAKSTDALLSKNFDISLKS